jgi:hypothetical protein
MAVFVTSCSSSLHATPIPPSHRDALLLMPCGMDSRYSCHMDRSAIASAPRSRRTEQILDVRPVTPDATQSGCYYLGHSHSRRGQEGPDQLSGMLFARRDVVDSGYSCTQDSDLRRNKGPEHNLDVLAMTFSVESCHPCPWSLHLRHAQEGPGQLLNILAMPDTMESSGVHLFLTGHLHVRHAQEGL